MEVEAVLLGLLLFILFSNRETGPSLRNLGCRICEFLAEWTGVTGFIVRIPADEQILFVHAEKELCH
jgi:hypothetical protein